jgi:hypothetical protein
VDATSGVLQAHPEILLPVDEEGRVRHRIRDLETGHVGVEGCQTHGVPAHVFAVGVELEVVVPEEIGGDLRALGVDDFRRELGLVLRVVSVASALVEQVDRGGAIGHGPGQRPDTSLVVRDLPAEHLADIAAAGARAGGRAIGDHLPRSTGDRDGHVGSGGGPTFAVEPRCA